MCGTFIQVTPATVKMRQEAQNGHNANQGGNTGAPPRGADQAPAGSPGGAGRKFIE